MISNWFIFIFCRLFELDCNNIDGGGGRKNSHRGKHRMCLIKPIMKDLIILIRYLCQTKFYHFDHSKEGAKNYCGSLSFQNDQVPVL